MVLLSVRIIYVQKRAAKKKNSQIVILRSRTQMTFDDPQMYTKPFTIRIPHDLLADDDIFEMFCNENEKDRAHLQKK